MTETRGWFITRGALYGLVVSWAAIVGAFVWLWITSASVDSLGKTDRIACQFLNADAATRVKQNQSTRVNQLTAETAFLHDADEFLALFKKVPPRKVTPGIRIFKNYVVAERTLVRSIRDGSAANVRYSQQLAATGIKLADQLHCT